MMQFINFFYEFISHPIKTGAIAPSSKGLSELITDCAALSKASSVLEFGPGTGVFTEKILEKIGDTTLFFTIESNARFVWATRKRCPDLTVYHDSAVNAGYYLKHHGITHCDCIISGLPFASFNQELQNNLLHTILSILPSGGLFLTFAYLQGMILPSGRRFRRKLQSHFKKVSTTRPIWLNTPPALVYCAEK